MIYRAAMQGMLTGVMLAVARIAGETAPLLFTALNNQFWSTDMNAPMANLPVVIFQFALSPYADWQRLAWGGALLITFTILIAQHPRPPPGQLEQLRPNDHRNRRPVEPPPACPSDRIDVPVPGRRTARARASRQTAGRPAKTVTRP